MMEKTVQPGDILQYLCDIFLQAGGPNMAPPALSGAMLLHTGAEPVLLSLGCAGLSWILEPDLGSLYQQDCNSQLAS